MHDAERWSPDFASWEVNPTCYCPLPASYSGIYVLWTESVSNGMHFVHHIFHEGSMHPSLLLDFAFWFICLLISELRLPGMIQLLPGSLRGLQTTEIFWTIQTDRHTQILLEPANTGPYFCLILCYRPYGQCSPH